ncbi:MAG: hypothetical protein HY322_00490 [Betaproteobacteria bacterium]|nr:hypothetical protein [Betaproteobacteria bacterium]
MDKAILNLITILIAGTGVIGSLITYEPQELNATYLDFNPFAYKKSEIEKVLRRAFVYLALFGLAIQAYPFFVTGLPDQKHTLTFYLSFFVIGAAVMAGLGLGIRRLCMVHARKSRFPELRNRMREMYESSLFIMENDGWRADQLQVKDQLNNPEMCRNANFESADSRITTLQKAFDIPDVPGDRKAKIAILKRIFE